MQVSVGNAAQVDMFAGELIFVHAGGAKVFRTFTRRAKLEVIPFLRTANQVDPPSPLKIAKHCEEAIAALQNSRRKNSPRNK